MKIASRMKIVCLVGLYSGFAHGNQTGMTRVLPGGIAFPAIYHAAGVNAASLTSQKGYVVEAGYGPEGDPWTVDRAEAAFVASQKSFGLGVQYLGLHDSGGNWTHGGAIGAAARLDPVSLGVGLRDSNVSAGAEPAVDLAIDFQPEGGGQGVHAGGILYEVNGGPYLGVYLGMIKEKQHFLEASIVTPRFGRSGDYQFGVAAGVHAGIFGVSFFSRYYTSSRTFAHTLGAGIWIMEFWNVGIQFDTPRNFLLRTVLRF